MTGRSTVIIDHNLASILEKVLKQRISDKGISCVLQLRKESLTLNDKCSLQIEISHLGIFVVKGLTKVPRTKIRAFHNIQFPIPWKFVRLNEISPVDTTTYRRIIDVETTSCVYWEETRGKFHEIWMFSYSL